MSARRGPTIGVVTDDESIDVLRQAILSQARAEAEEITNEARAQAEDLLKEAQADAEKERDSVLEDARRKAEILRAEAVGEGEIAAHQLQLKKREELMDRVFEDARAQLPDVATHPDYVGVLRRLTREALNHLGADGAVVRFDARTQDALGGQLSELVQTVGRELEVDLEMGEPLDDGTGVVVATADGHRRYDNTLQARLRRMESNLRASVYRILVKGTS